MVVINGLSLPAVARIAQRPLERLKYVARRAHIAPAARVGTIGLYTVDQAAEIVSLASAVRPYRRRDRRRKAQHGSGTTGKQVR